MSILANIISNSYQPPYNPEIKYGQQAKDIVLHKNEMENPVTKMTHETLESAGPSATQARSLIRGQVVDLLA